MADVANSLTVDYGGGCRRLMQRLMQAVGVTADEDDEATEAMGGQCG